MNIVKTSVGIVGLGSIGQTVAEYLKNHEHYELTAVVGRDVTKTQETLDRLDLADVSVVNAESVADAADLIIDSAPAEAFRSFAEPVIRAGKILIVFSVGALLENWDLVDLAAKTGATIQVLTGAIAGLDGVQAAAQGTIHSAKIVTRKPASGLGVSAGSGEDPDTAKLLFSGSVREAFKQFPANVNVAVAFSLAGIGPDRTEIEVWADSALERNTHTLTVESDSGKLVIMVEGIPSANPKTAKLTAQSAIAWLKKNHTDLKIGS